MKYACFSDSSKNKGVCVTQNRHSCRKKKKNTPQNLPMIYSTIQTATKDRAMTKKKDNLEENP